MEQGVMKREGGGRNDEAAWSRDGREKGLISGDEEMGKVRGRWG